MTTTHETYKVTYDPTNRPWLWLVSDGAGNIMDEFRTEAEARETANTLTLEAETTALVDLISGVLADADLDTLRKVARLLGL